MIVSELIEKLQQLSADSIVYREIEGEMCTVKRASVLKLHTWSVGGSVTEDFMPETRLDSDEAKFSGIVLD